MASPFLQPEWSVEEAVLLVQASENIASSLGDVNSEVGKLSRRLRSGAITLGLSISDRYRNEEEVLRNLKVVNTMLKMVDSVEDDYFECSSLGKVSILFIRNKTDYYSILDVANEKYPVIKDIEPVIEDVVVAEPITEYKTERKRRPRISQYFVTASHNQTNNNGSNPGELSHSDSYQENSNSFVNESSHDKEDDAENGIPETMIEKQTRPMSSYELYLNYIRKVLIQNFSRGYRLGSAIEMKRFRMAYKAIHGKPMTFKDENLVNFIRSAGFEYDNKVYIPEKSLPSHIAEEIETYITNTFYGERKYIYFKNLYELFKDSLLDTLIANPEMLRLFLESLKRERWYINSQFISCSPHVAVSILDEVSNFLLERQGVVSIDELKDSLDYLPSEKVEHEWATNNDIFISNGRNEKFHIKSFVITDSQLREVAMLIETALESTPFITADKLLEEIRLYTPELFENNPTISNLGIRNALGTLLNKRFSFRNNLISTIENSYSGPEAMVAYCKKLGSYTLADANAMADIIGGTINFYLEKISEVSIRVNANDFIPRESLNFDVTNIDKALDIIVSGSFTPMASISNFEVLPSCGDYPWTIFLLESYLLRASNKYRYIHPSYLAQEGVIGGIVPAASPIKTYDDLLILAIGESDVPIDEASCNQYLYDLGLLASRRKNGAVKGLLTKAKECRNRIKHKKID